MGRNKEINEALLSSPRQVGMRRRRLLPPDQFGVVPDAFARHMGTPAFIVWMAVVIGIGLGWNIWAAPEWRFDPYPFQFLTLRLSVQASFAAPLILLAQNRQEFRDRVGLELDRQTLAQSRADTDFLAREIADLNRKVGEVSTRNYLAKRLDKLEAVIAQSAAHGEHPGAARRRDRPLLVVVPGLEDDDVVAVYQVHQPVLAGDASRPGSG